MPGEVAGETGPERLSVIAEVHADCVRAKVEEGWLVDGMSVRCRGRRYDKHCGQPEVPVEKCPLRT
jgi:hypothetical protein